MKCLANPAPGGPQPLVGGHGRVYELPGAEGSWIDPVSGVIVARRRSGMNCIAHMAADCAIGGRCGADVLAVLRRSMVLSGFLLSMSCVMRRGPVPCFRRSDVDFSR